jgi:ferredoxin
MHRQVWAGQSLTLGRNRRIFKTLDKDNVNFEGFDTTSRQRIGHTSESKKSFKDTRLTFTEEQLKKETERCLGCGAAIVDQNHCLGCGQCVTQCKMEAITLSKKFDAPGIKLEKFLETIMTNAMVRQEKIDQKAASAN